jgi:hypothetical protein
MKPSDIKQLQYGDKIHWEDPEELRSRTVVVKKAKVNSYDNITIETTTGDILHCPAKQIKKV